MPPVAVKVISLLLLGELVDLERCLCQTDLEGPEKKINTKVEIKIQFRHTAPSFGTLMRPVKYLRFEHS